MEKIICELSFEEALEELEKIVNSLENNETPLEDAIQLYQRGNELKKHCESTLRTAEERVQKIVLDNKGDPIKAEDTEF